MHSRVSTSMKQITNLRPIRLRRWHQQAGANMFSKVMLQKQNDYRVRIRGHHTIQHKNDSHLSGANATTLAGVSGGGAVAGRSGGAPPYSPHEAGGEGGGSNRNELN